jgi:fructose/tagatose bisphosphate aldolase
VSELLAKARAGGYAVGYFEAWDTYSLEAVADAAEAERSPVVLGFGGMMMDQEWLDRYGIEPLGAYGRAVAEGMNAPAGLTLNEVWQLEHARRGIDAGFNVVMLNACEMPFARNVELTRRLVELAHPKGVEVQAELGRLPDFGDDDPGELTDPGQAREFVAATGVDFLAVSVGNVHLRTEGASGIDHARLRAIRREVDVPLVIHGGSGLSGEAVRALIEEGVALFHVGTVMKKRFLEAARTAIAGLEGARDYQATVGSRKPSDFLIPGRAAITEAVRALMRCYGSSGRAG